MYNTIDELKAAGIFKPSVALNESDAPQHQPSAVFFDQPTVLFTVVVNALMALIYFGLPRLLA